MYFWLEGGRLERSGRGLTAGQRTYGLQASRTQNIPPRCRSKEARFFTLYPSPSHVGGPPVSGAPDGCEDRLVRLGHPLRMRTPIAVQNIVVFGGRERVGRQVIGIKSRNGPHDEWWGNGERQTTNKCCCTVRKTWERNTYHYRVPYDVSGAFTPPDGP